MKSESKSPVFIIGGSRTGSTMLQVILSTSPEINLTDEMQFRTPWWLHRDFLQDMRSHVGRLDAEGARNQLIDMIYSDIPEGWFWSAADRLMDREILVEELDRQPLTERSVFDAVLRSHARSQGKPRIGAKFPVHYLYTDMLLDWYPDCYLIHTTRNPKAVYASQAAKYLKEEQSASAQAYMRLRQFAHINIQVSLTARLHSRFRDRSNYRLVRYEDLVTNPEEEIRELCRFLAIDFQPGMLEPEQFGSSFGRISDKGQGIAQSRLERWRTSISPATARLIDTLHPRAYGILGYRHG